MDKKDIENYFSIIEQNNKKYYEFWKNNQNNQNNSPNKTQLLNKIMHILCCGKDGNFCIADEKSDAYQTTYQCSCIFHKERTEQIFN